MTSDPYCIFCKIAAGNEPSFTIYDDAEPGRDSEE